MKKLLAGGLRRARKRSKVGSSKEAGEIGW